MVQIDYTHTRIVPVYQDLSAGSPGVPVWLEFTFVYLFSPCTLQNVFHSEALVHVP
jgi:hypothetical protein